MHAQIITIEHFADLLAGLVDVQHQDAGMLCTWHGRHADLGPVVLVQGPCDFALVAERPIEAS